MSALCGRIGRRSRACLPARARATFAFRSARAAPDREKLCSRWLTHSTSNRAGNSNGNVPADRTIFWRVEGSLLNLTAVRPVGFFTWNAQSFLGRWMRRGTMGALAVGQRGLFASNRVFATRVLHTVLRGESRDRLDLLGEEFFEYFLKPRLKQPGVAKLKEVMATGGDVVLVSQGLDHIMRPLANYLGVDEFFAIAWTSAADWPRDDCSIP